ncbi:MAG: hypothetical protein EB150_09460, partial [Nitrososphaeria archaeon]|nr:hypothetical protein [Nitrososphaeria archaeon]
MQKINNKIIYLAIIAAAIAATGFSYNWAIGSHGFEQGASTGTLPTAVTVPLAGQVMRPGDYFPLADYSPNYV